MSELKVNKVTPRSGTTVTLGDSGDTITIPSGATITNSGTATGFNPSGTITIDNIQFPATQVASANANNLDDYEEGTWTPSVGGTATYNNQSGIYTKIGRLVIASFDLNINTIGTGSKSAISGLPFTSSSSVDGVVAPVSYFQDLDVSVYWLAWRIDNGSAVLNNTISTALAVTPSVNQAILKNSSRIIATVTYYT